MTMANNTTIMSPPVTILDGDLEKLGFRFLNFYQGTYIYWAKNMDFELNRLGGIAGNRFRIFKGKDKKYDGIVTSTTLLKTILNTVGYEC